VEVSGQLHTLAALLPGKESPIPTGWRLGRPKRQSGCNGKEKNSQLLLGIEP